MALIYSGNFLYGSYNGGVALVGINGVGSLTGNGGGPYSAFGAIFGVNAGSTGSVSLSNNTQIDIGAYGLIVGLRGRGTATIGGGSVVNSSGAYFNNASIGEYAGSVGTLTVTGAGSQLISSGTDNAVSIARSGGTGTLNVLAGGLVETLGLYVARAGNGTVNVSGVGSHLVVSNDNGSYSSFPAQAGFASFGGNAGSRGILNVTAGGVVDIRDTATEDNPALRLGLRSGSVGIGIVDGAGSQINISQQAAGIYGPNLQLGVQGDGTLTVRNGGAVNITGDNATLFVSTGWNVDGLPPTALLAQSELIIQTGGVVTVTDTGAGFDTVSVGTEQFGNGAIRISGAGSKLVSIGTTNDEINIGNRGTGLLTIGTGGEVIGRRMFVGYHAGSTGTVQISGAGSKLTLASGDAYAGPNTAAALFVGTRGNSTFTVSAAAHVNLTGARAFLSVGDGYNAAGPGATGVLSIQSGGVVTVDHGTNPTAGYTTIDIGTQVLGVGTINVTGAGSKLISAGSEDYILVGDAGKGTLNVLAGGEVQGQLMFVGLNDTATGTVVVDGAASKITLVSPDVFDPAIYSARLWVGNRGDGTMTVRAGATVGMTGAQAHLFVGDGYGLIAPDGKGLLNIQSGGKVTVTNTDLIGGYGAIDIGAREFGDGTVIVTGAGSTLTAAGTTPHIGVGDDGKGTLSVQAGGKVVALSMTVSNDAGSIGTLNINGAGSKVTLSNDTHTAGFYGDTYAGSMTVGNYAGSTGTMNITAGGVLEIRNSATGGEVGPFLGIGNRDGSIGVVTVDGAGSAINMKQTGGVGPEYGPFLGVGNRGDGTLTVKNSAQINLTGEYGQFRVSRGNDALEPEAANPAPFSEAFIQSGADVTINMSGGIGYGAAVRISQEANSNGRLTIDGSGSTLNILGNNTGISDSEKANLIVAQHGAGELIVTNGADVFINGGDDKHPHLTVGQESGSLGTLTISGVGSTINLLTTNTAADGGGLITVGRGDTSSGVMNILTGAQIINDLGSTNSAMTVGANTTSVGAVIVDGDGNVATLLDAGQLLVVGAGWNESGATLGDVTFSGGGTGSVMVLDGATVRANNTAVGIGGTIGGNGKFDGNVTVDGGAVVIGASPGILTVTGALTVSNTTLDFEVLGLAAGTQYDQLKVTGAVTIVSVNINLNIDGTAFSFVDGNRILLIDGVAPLLVDINAVNVAITNEPAALAYSIADEGADLVFEALNNGLGLGTGIVSFGAASVLGATATINNGTGSGTGGRFNSVRFVNATGLEGTAGADSFSSTGAQAMTLLGLGGNDTLSSLTAADIMDGGAGLDTVNYALSGAGVTVTLTGAVESIAAGGNAAGDRIKNIENIIGSGLADILTGDGLANVIDGGGGADTMAGGLGNDTYVVDSLTDAITDAGGIELVRSSIDYSIAAAVTLENLTLLAGFGDIDATGNALANILTGNEGDNRLNGGLGIDTMIGGLGNDTYVVDVAGDKVTELAGGGTADTIETALATYSLAALLQVENLTYTGAGNFIGTGNALANTIRGGTGTDTLTGGAGIDTLIGLGGSDIYKVDNTLDVVDETGGSGIDRVDSTATFTLGTDVENLTLLGALVINGTGNAGINTIIGNTGANIIEGKGGGDTLNGGAGVDTVSFATSTLAVNVALNGALAATASGGDATGDIITNFENIIGSGLIDTLTGDGLANVINGGGGADIMAGGLGNDTYMVDNALDSVTDIGVGVDLVRASVTYSLVAAANVENLTLAAGAGDINATGSGIANILTGNEGNNRLDGGAGVDTMVGGLGNDTYVVDVATDKVTELAGGGTADTVETALATYSLAALLQVENLTFTGAGGFTGTGNALANTITGGVSGDNLNGGLGNDMLIGGGGADSFIFNSSIAAINVDTIDDFTLGEDIIKLENAIFTAVGVAGALSAGAFASNTDGLAADATDRIIYNSTNGWLNYDSNGSTVGGVIVHFATIDTGLSLTAADFLII